MDDTLKRRLTGAAVLLLGALALTSLLPDPDRRPGEPAAPVVAYDLRTGAPLNLPQPQPSPAPVKLKPVEIGGIEPAGGEAEATPAPEAVKPDTPKPDPRPEAAKAEPAKPEPGKLAQKSPAPPQPSSKAARPSLKVDETFGTTGASAWFVQIGSFSSKDNARAEQMKLAKLGLPAIMQAITVEKKLWYRVRVGPYQAEAPAQQALSTVRKQGYASAKVARPDTAPN